MWWSICWSSWHINTILFSFLSAPKKVVGEAAPSKFNFFVVQMWGKVWKGGGADATCLLNTFPYTEGERDLTRFKYCSQISIENMHLDQYTAKNSLIDYNSYHITYIQFNSFAKKTIISQDKILDQKCVKFTVNRVYIIHTIS